MRILLRNWVACEWWFVRPHLNDDSNSLANLFARPSLSWFKVSDQRHRRIADRRRRWDNGCNGWSSQTQFNYAIFTLSGRTIARHWSIWIGNNFLFGFTLTHNFHNAIHILSQHESDRDCCQFYWNRQGLLWEEYFWSTSNCWQIARNSTKFYSIFIDLKVMYFLGGDEQWTELGHLWTRNYWSKYTF